MENQVMDTLEVKNQKDNSGKAKAGFILGLISIVAWFIPLFGVPVTIVGLVMSILGIKSSKKKLAIAGVILTIIFLILTIINAAVGAAMVSKMLAHK
jgi:uncharacterized membrane protein